MAAITNELIHPASRQIASPERQLRSVGSLRYERGGIVYALDGRIGTLRQVVVDDRAGVVTSLVVQTEKRKELILLPPGAVLKTGGSAVFLNGTVSQFEAWLVQAPRFDPRRAGKVDLKSLLRPRSDPAVDARRAVVAAGRDYLETGSTESVKPG